MSQQQWTHNSLVEDLAVALDTPYTEVPLGSVWMGYARSQRDKIDRILGKKAWDDPAETTVQRADVVQVRPSYTRFCISIYEVKASRADFLNDIRSEKWRGYLIECHRFYFATPSGIVSTVDIPDEAGWMVRGPNGWRCAKRARPQDPEVSQEFLLSLIFLRKRLMKRARVEKFFMWQRGFRSEQLYMKVFGKKAGKLLYRMSLKERKERKA